MSGRNCQAFGKHTLLCGAICRADLVAPRRPHMQSGIQHPMYSLHRPDQRAFGDGQSSRPGQNAGPFSYEVNHASEPTTPLRPGCSRRRLSVSPAIGQNAIGLDQRPAQVTRGEPGRPLFAMPGAAPSDITAGYLRSRGRSDAVLASLRTTRSGAGANGVTHLRLEQVVDGLAVHGAYVKAAVNARGELVQVIDRLAAVTALTPNRVDALAALQAAMAQVHPGQAATFRRTGAQGNVNTFDGGTFFHSPPTATAVAIPMSDGTLARGWLVETWTAEESAAPHAGRRRRPRARGREAHRERQLQRVHRGSVERAAERRRPDGRPDRVAAGLARHRLAVDDQHPRQQRQRLSRYQQRRSARPGRHGGHMAIS